MNRFFFLLVRYLIPVLSLLTFALPEQAERAVTSVETGSGPELERLVKAFRGEWTVVETFERSNFFPNGAFAKELRDSPSVRVAQL